MKLLDSFLGWCRLVRKARYHADLYDTQGIAFQEGVEDGRLSVAGDLEDCLKRLAAFRLEANTARAQRDALQADLDRANDRLTEAGMIAVTTFVK